MQKHIKLEIQGQSSESKKYYSSIVDSISLKIGLPSSSTTWSTKNQDSGQELQDQVEYIKSLQSSISTLYSEFVTKLLEILSLQTDVQSPKVTNPHVDFLEYYQTLVDTIFLKLTLLQTPIPEFEEMKLVQEYLCVYREKWEREMEERVEFGVEFEMVLQEWRGVEKKLEIVESDIQRLSSF
jgi:hypothetical protein